MNAPPVQFTQTEDGVSIAYQQRGSGPPLVVSSGLIPPLEEDWREDGWAGRLARRFRVVRFDPRGCGLSQFEVGADGIDAEAEDVAAAARATGSPKVALLGYSLGVSAAVACAVREPDLVQRLILHAPIVGRAAATSEPIDPEAEHPAQLAGEVIEGLMKLGFRYNDEPARRAMMTMVIPEASADELALIGESLRAYASAERILQVVPQLRSRTTEALLSRIRTPTLVSVPAEEAGRSDGRRWTRSIEGAQMVVVRSRSGIILPGSPAVEDFARAVEDFAADEHERAARPDAAARTRTVLFTDLKDSTDLTDRLGIVEARRIMREVERLTRAAIHAHGGTEVKGLGDGMMAWFPLASGALDAAVELQQAVGRMDGPVEIGLSIGVDAGEPIEESGDLFGAAVNRAARIVGCAGEGEVLVSSIVRGLVQGQRFRFNDRGLAQLRGIAESTHLFELDWRSRNDDAAPGSAESTRSAT